MTLTHNGLVRKQGLSETDLQAIFELEAICNTHDNLKLKLNPDLLKIRPTTETNDFLYYQDGKLVGFLPLFCFNRQEAEFSGMVHPDYRRQGIFTALAQAAREEIRSRQVPKILYIVPNSSASGKAWMQASGFAYEFSEFWMKMQEVKPCAAIHELTMRLAEERDEDILTRALTVCFNLPEDAMRKSVTDRREPGRARYAIELAGDVIGTIGVHYDDESSTAFLYGFCILPDFQGQGYGRQAMMWSIHKALADGMQHVELEVATENDNALNLYRSCGFDVISGNDYYAEHLTV
ncbi:MAG TPA: GNAT family N-acetyltransferase [Bacilli bacterium]|nr:GNAT family N-acetyltransferase [Bacilli bacterium]